MLASLKSSEANFYRLIRSQPGSLNIIAGGIGMAQPAYLIFLSGWHGASHGMLMRPHLSAKD
jgi:hypothetical protein